MSEDKLKLIPTRILVDELISRKSIEWYQIEKNQQFSFTIAHKDIDYTNHMPKTILILVDVVEMEKELLGAFE